MIEAIEKLLEYDRAGCPVSGLQWTRRTTDKIAAQLGKLGISISANTVARLLKQLGFRLRVNHKKLSRPSAPDRDEQFRHIAELRERFAKAGQPIISIDTKKKELIGNFKNPGQAWSRVPVAVNDHDFRSDASGRAVPYGIYDVLANRGTLYIGTTTRPVRRSGIRSSTGSSAKSRRTGPAGRSTASIRSSHTQAAPPPELASTSPPSS